MISLRNAFSVARVSSNVVSRRPSGFGPPPPPDLDPRSRSGSGYGLPGPKPLTNLDPPTKMRNR